MENMGEWIRQGSGSQGVNLGNVHAYTRNGKEEYLGETFLCENKQMCSKYEYFSVFP